MDSKEFASPCWVWSGLTAFSKNQVGLLVYRNQRLSFVDPKGQELFKLEPGNVASFVRKSGFLKLKVINPIFGKTTLRLFFRDVYGDRHFSIPPGYEALVANSYIDAGELTKKISPAELAKRPSPGLSTPGRIQIGEAIAVYQAAKLADKIAGHWAMVLAEDYAIKTTITFKRSYWTSVAIFVLGAAIIMPISYYGILHLPEQYYYVPFVGMFVGFIAITVILIRAMT